MFSDKKDTVVNHVAPLSEHNVIVCNEKVHVPFMYLCYSISVVKGKSETVSEGTFKELSKTLNHATYLFPLYGEKISIAVSHDQKRTFCSFTEYLTPSESLIGRMRDICYDMKTSYVEERFEGQHVFVTQFTKRSWVMIPLWILGGILIVASIRLIVNAYNEAKKLQFHVTHRPPATVSA